jgi:hypothetical protein
MMRTSLLLEAGAFGFWSGLGFLCLYYSCDYCRVFSCDYAGMLNGTETTFSRVNKACRNMFHGDYSIGDLGADIAFRVEGFG